MPDSVMSFKPETQLTAVDKLAEETAVVPTSMMTQVTMRLQTLEAPREAVSPSVST